MLHKSWNKSYFSPFIFLILIFSSGCDNFSPLEGESPVADKFTTLSIDDRVLFKPGMKERALLVHESLDDEIKNIEETHGKPFSKQVVVHICDTQECFNSYTGIQGGILAAVTSKGLFLSPGVFSQGDYSAWLAHELSHLHLFQHISILRASFIPQWYHDGLATYASNGGGADRVNRQKALEYIAQGKHIIPVNKGSLFRQRWPLNYTPSSNDWPQPWYQQHMDYRQASLFYEFLHPKGGVELLRAIESGERFRDAFYSVYNKTPDEMFHLFKASVTSNEWD